MYIDCTQMHVVYMCVPIMLSAPSTVRHVKTNSYTGVKGSPLLKAKSPKDKIILTGSPSLSPRIRRKIEVSSSQNLQEMLCVT